LIVEEKSADSHAAKEFSDFFDVTKSSDILYRYDLSVIYECSSPEKQGIVVDFAFNADDAHEVLALAKCETVETGAFIFQVTELEADKKYAFTWYNADGSAIAVGTADAEIGTIEFEEVYGGVSSDTYDTKGSGKKSAETWVCDLGVGTSGVIWGTAVVMASAFAGAIVSIGFLVLTECICP